MYCFVNLDKQHVYLFSEEKLKRSASYVLMFILGIWGSAFCILFKRLLEDNRRLDPVEMIRQDMGKSTMSNACIHTGILIDNRNRESFYI